ncbi:MAG: hypothetical protein ACQKBY_07735 [Verrucomicrobiales bacterium]
MKMLSTTNPRTTALGLLLLASSASLSPAQSLIESVFSGSNGLNNTTLTASSGVVSLAPTSVSDTSIGPGWEGEVGFGIAAPYSATMGINEGGNESFGFDTGGLLGVVTNFEASKTFSESELDHTILPNTLYALDLTINNAGAVQLLGNYEVGIEIGGAEVNNGTNTGLLGLADVLGLFGGTNQATLYFTTPDTISSHDLTFSTSGNMTASLLGTGFSITNASIRQVIPEPGIAILGILGALPVLRRRR